MKDFLDKIKERAKARIRRFLDRLKDKFTKVATAFTALLAVIFSYQVLAGDATLTWEPPTGNTDGSELTNLAGYRLYRSVDGSEFSLLADVNNPATLTYIDGGLDGGDYCYNVTAYNALALESEPQGPVCKTVAPRVPNPVRNLEIF